MTQQQLEETSSCTRPVVIISDLDETFWVSGSHCPEVNKEVLSALLKDDRLKVVVCTGRSLPGTRMGMKRFGVDNLPLFPGVYNDGAIVYGDTENELLFFKGLTDHQVLTSNEIFTFLDKDALVAFITPTTQLCMHSERLKHLQGLDGKNRWDETISHTDTLPLGKNVLAIFLHTCAVQETERLFAERLPELEVLPLNNMGWMMVKPSGHDKMKGLEILAKRYNWDLEDLVCIGDGANDCSMLSNIPDSIVMKDGHQRALACGKTQSMLGTSEGGWSDALLTALSRRKILIERAAL